MANKNVIKNQKVLVISRNSLERQESGFPFVTGQTFLFSQDLGEVACDAFRRIRPTSAFTFSDGGLSTRALERPRPSKILEAYHTVLGLFRHPIAKLIISKITTRTSPTG